MGYTTEFEGHFNVTPPLTAEQVEYLSKFNKTRRVRRDPRETQGREDPVREAVGLHVGPQGGYFVGETGLYGQDQGPDVRDSNIPPAGQPGLWCQWEASADGSRIQWDGGEKFYEYVDWLKYIVEHFLKPWGRTISGEVCWYGEDHGDRGRISADKNKVRC